MWREQFFRLIVIIACFLLGCLAALSLGESGVMDWLRSLF